MKVVAAAEALEEAMAGVEEAVAAVAVGVVVDQEVAAELEAAVEVAGLEQL